MNIYIDTIEKLKVKWRECTGNLIFFQILPLKLSSHFPDIFSLQRMSGSPFAGGRSYFDTNFSNILYLDYETYWKFSLLDSSHIELTQKMKEKIYCDLNGFIEIQNYAARAVPPKQSIDWLLQDHLTGIICFGGFTMIQAMAFNLKCLQPDLGYVPEFIQIQEMKLCWSYHKT